MRVAKFIDLSNQITPNYYKYGFIPQSIYKESQNKLNEKIIKKKLQKGDLIFTGMLANSNQLYGLKFYDGKNPIKIKDKKDNLFVKCKSIKEIEKYAKDNYGKNIKYSDNFWKHVLGVVKKSGYKVKWMK